MLQRSKGVQIPYDCNPQNADGFDKTTKEIAEYVNREYQYGSHFRSAIITEKKDMPALDKPKDVASTASMTDKDIWKQEISAYIKKKTAADEHVRSLFSLVLGQCTDAMKAKLEALPDWDDMQSKMNGLALIKEVKKIASSRPTSRAAKRRCTTSIKRCAASICRSRKCWTCTVSASW